jgi:CheY-like chemotaxis protein
LGLFICKRLAELMNGSVNVSSQFGEGSTFSVYLQPKWLKQMPQMKTALSGKESEVDYAKISVLVVEDNQVNQLIAKKLLEKIGVKVSVAENGKQALEVLRHTTFDLVFMDCQMPVMDGFEATRQMRKFDRNTPVIALTANIQPADRQACYQAGMNDFISKPFKPEDITQMLNHYCRA